MATPLLLVDRIGKGFAGVRALHEVSLEVRRAEVHALVGENGAGKSTLMKILAGVYPPDTGRISWSGRTVRLSTPAEARALGISIIFQEFTLLPHLSVAENVLLDREPRTRLGLIRWRELRERTRGYLALLKADVDPNALVGTLSVAQQQLVEIAKALTYKAQLIIMDEPTAALNPHEVEGLFERIHALKAAGSSVIFISHRLTEVLRISDRVTVLKDGERVGSGPTAGLTETAIVRQMVGRSLTEVFPPRRRAHHGAQPILEVENLANRALQGVELALYPGEIVGVAGLEGQGQRELARTLFGLAPSRGARMTVQGQPLRLRHPRDAIRAGFAFVSDDRKAEGLALTLGVGANVALPSLSRWSRLGVSDLARESQEVQGVTSRLGVKTPSLKHPVRLLSGGNQQKTVLAKWLIRPPQLLIVTEPTRGIDVGAKVEIYRLLHALAGEGSALLMISSDLIELLGLSTRILVMHQGRIVQSFPGDDATEERIMMAATGATSGAQRDRLS